MAAKKLERNFIGIEKDAGYWRIAAIGWGRRWLAVYDIGFFSVLICRLFSKKITKENKRFKKK